MNRSLVKLVSYCFAFFVVQLFCATLVAQPMGISFDTLEALIAKSDTVVIGSIESVFEEQLNEKHSDHTKGFKKAFAVSVKADQVIKGSDKPLSKLRFYATPNAGILYRKWAKEKTKGIWLLGPEVSIKGSNVVSYQGGFPVIGRSWRFLSLTKNGNYGPGNFPPMLSNDLSVLDDKSEVLAKAAAYGPISEMDSKKPGPKTYRIRIPDSIGQKISQRNSFAATRLTLAIDNELDSIATRMIENPKSFLDEPHQKDNFSLYRLRFAGTELLRYYKSPANEILLRKQMASRLTEYEKSGGFDQIRVKAYEILLSWNVDVAKPEFAKKITSLDLHNTEANESLAKKLKQLEKLSTLRFKDRSINDAQLKTLRNAGLLHCISVALTFDDESRPRSSADVADLSLFGFPITDLGILEILHFKNLVMLDLRETKISDASIKPLRQLTKLKIIHLNGCPISDAGLGELAKMKSLTRISIANTNASKAGIEKLKSALPNCKVVSTPRN